MQTFNVITRRGFLDRSVKIGLGVALSTLTDIPLVLKRALADGSIGGNGKKVIFLWMRGANDGLNSLIPVNDSGYAASRSSILIPTNGTAYNNTTGGCEFTPANGGDTFPADGTGKQYALALQNGFAGLHPSLKFLAPVYNAGELALIHRVAYANQSRSHFDSQNYWENGTPNNKLVTDGIFYRTMLQSILNGTAKNPGLTGVSIQSALPMILRGSATPMTNLTDPTRYNLLGIPNTTAGNSKADKFMNASTDYPFPPKMDRDFLQQQYENLATTLQVFAGIDFSETGNTFTDDPAAPIDGGASPYYLFPTTNAKNGGGVTNRYVVDTGAYTLFKNIKAAAMILNKTDAIVAGTEFSGFDTHNSQGNYVGSHANLQRRIGWAMFALKQYFTRYSDKVSWNDVIVVTLSEFGRTSKENGSKGTDHAEAGVMFVAGGGVKGYGKTPPGGGSARTSGVFACGPNPEVYNGTTINWNTGTSGSMFTGTTKNYLQRAVDYRSVLGEIIRDHLGASQTQLNSIIPGYANTKEKLASGGVSGIDNTTIAGELNII
ncbi:MAG: hypothetical protein JWO95_323 [Verrucomicrobiales bacterium]|nr:hypothetical protein [Verrucomicrobiales bacterium]